MDTPNQLREVAQILVRGNEFVLPNPELADELYIEAMINGRTDDTGPIDFSD